VFNFSYRSKGKPSSAQYLDGSVMYLFSNILLGPDILQKELARQVVKTEVKEEKIEKKRKRNEDVDEDLTYMSDDNDFFVAEPRSGRKSQRSGEPRVIETIDLMDDLDDD
jgi:hypothetical protein